MKKKWKNIMALVLALVILAGPFTVFGQEVRDPDGSEQGRVELIEKFERKLAEAKEIKDDGNRFPGAYDLLQKDIQTAERNFNNNKDKATLEALQKYYDGFLVAINGYEDSYYTDLIDVQKALQEEDPEEKILKVGTINISNKKYYEESFSMSNGAIVNPARILETNKGYKLIYSFKSLNIMIYKGFLGKLFVSEKGDQQGSETFHEMNPLSHYTVQDYYNHPETGIDEALKGKFYPKEFILPVYQEDNPVYIQVYVPVMEEIMPGGGTQKARLFLDWDSLNLEELVDKSPLEEKIREAEEIVIGNKTQEAFESLQGKIAAAKTTLENAMTNGEINEGVATLEEAIKAFHQSPDQVDPIDKSPLEEKIKEAEEIVIGNKTQEAFESLQGKIAAAKTTLENAMTNGEINEGVATLEEAIKAFYQSPDQVDPVDKTALINIIAEAEQVDTTNKTDDTVAIFEFMLAQAKTVNEKAEATNEEVQNAITNLQNAIGGLEDVVQEEPVVPEEPTNLDYRNLPDGMYAVDMNIMHYNRESGKKSMADGAVVKPAHVVVENGQYYLQMEMTSLQFMGFTGYLGDLHHQDANGTFRPVEMLDFYHIQDEFYPILKEYYQKNYPNTPEDEINYPKILRYPIEKPTGEIQETVAQVFVPVMESLGDGGGTQKCLPTINWKPFIEEHGSTPEPDPTPKPPVSNVDTERLNEEILLSLNRSYHEYTPQSWNAFSTALTRAVVLSTRNDLTQREVDQAVANLQATRNALVKVNGNNNWGDNSGNNGNDGNNNNWGNNGNNNGNNNGPVTITYEVPVEVLKAYDSGYSMANNAINHTAKVQERNGQYRYFVQFGPMEREFGGKLFTGRLTNLFVYDGGKYRANSLNNGVWSFNRKSRDSRVKVAVWVDAMDEIAGGTPGAGEQDAILSFDWSRAREVDRSSNSNDPNFNNNFANTEGQKQSMEEVKQSKTPKLQQKSSTNKSAGQSKFNDITGHWAQKAIEYVTDKGYFAGTGDHTFTPDRGITRGEFVTVLGRIAKVDQKAYKETKFKDVKSDAFYGAYVNWASEMGIVAGMGDGVFAPDKTLSREEMAVIMCKYLDTFNVKLEGENKVNFTDQEKISSWAREAVKTIAEKGIVNGMEDGSFSPKTKFTRAQVAQVLYNIDHK